jgi:integrase
MVIYSFRHFFASNCLTNGIPTTDAAEWMGHKSLDITFRIYRQPHAGIDRKGRQDSRPRTDLLTRVRPLRPGKGDS